MAEIISLSNYVDEKVQALAKDRRLEDELRLRAHHQKIEYLKERAQGNLLIWLYRLLFGYPRPPQNSNISDNEAALSAGRSGERAVAQFLADLLPRDAIVLTGLCTRSGEVDAVVLAPHSLVCIEVKNVNGLIRIEGDSWSRRKLDRFGNIVSGPERIADRAGRSPSQQVNAITSTIRKVLADAGYTELNVRSMVMLTHIRAQVEVERLATTEVLHLSEVTIADFEGGYADPLPVRSLCALLKREHDRTKSPRENRRRKGASKPPAEKVSVDQNPSIPVGRSIRADRRYPK